MKESDKKYIMDNLKWTYKGNEMIVTFGEFRMRCVTNGKADAFSIKLLKGSMVYQLLRKIEKSRKK
jgi:hypothetical protein